MSLLDGHVSGTGDYGKVAQRHTPRHQTLGYYVVVQTGQVRGNIRERVKLNRAAGRIWKLPLSTSGPGPVLEGTEPSPVSGLVF